LNVVALVVTRYISVSCAIVVQAELYCCFLFRGSLDETSQQADAIQVYLLFFICDIEMWWAVYDSVMKAVDSYLRDSVPFPLRLDSTWH